MNRGKDVLLRGWAKFQPHLALLTVWLLAALVVALLVAIWWLGPDWSWGERQPLAPLAMRVAASTLVLAMPLSLWAVWLFWRNRQLLGERQQHTERLEDPCLVHLQAQTRALDASLATLRSHSHERGYLYRMPWYLVLGEQHAGKSSFIERSSQNFALSRVTRQAQPSDPDLAYPIDWWMGEQAVMIDPPGEFISQPERQVAAPALASAAGDDDEHLSVGPPPAGVLHEQSGLGLPAQAEKRLWQHLLGWLACNRSRQPLNGIVLLVDVVALLEGTPEQRRALAFVLRARLFELSAELGVRLPLYVVLSKFDLLEGFEELFAGLPAAQREEIFGFTFSLDAVHAFDTWLEELAKAYAQMVTLLNERVLQAMGEPRAQQEREMLLCLTRQVSGLQPLLLSFLRDVLGSDRYSTPALVRGLYLSSVYQQGVLSNAFLGKAARTYGFVELANAAKPQGRSVVYFAQHLLQRVIYPEAGLAGDNMKVALRKRRHLLAGSIAAGVLGLCLTAAWANYYLDNRAKTDQVLARSQLFSQLDDEQSLDPTGRNLLASLDEIHGALAVYGNYREAWPLANLGLYQGRAIGPMVDHAYLNVLSRRFLPALAKGVLETIRQAAPGSDEQLAALRVYRMLEERNNRRAQVVQEWMAKRWQQAYPGERAVQTALMRHLEYGLSYADADLPANDPLISEAQQQLRKLPLEQRLYLMLKQDAQEHLHGAFDLRNQVGPAFDLVFQLPQAGDSDGDDALIVPALMTANGFKQFFEPRSKAVSELAMIDQWVLGERAALDYSEHDRQALLDRLRALYSADYIDTWRRALNQLSVQPFADLSQALTVLEHITGPAAPMRRLLEAVREQSVIYPQVAVAAGNDERGAAQHAAAQLQAQGIRRAFNGLSGMLAGEGDKPSYYDETIKAISAMQDYAKSVQDSPNRGKAALALVTSRFTQTEPDPIANVQRIASGLPEPLNQQVRDLAEHTAQVLTVAALRELEKRWQVDVYSFFQARLAGRYPFRVRAEDAALEDFEAFFGPKGRLQTFQAQYLDVFLKDIPDALHGGEQRNQLVRREVIEQLAAAERIRETFFDASGNLSVQFNIEPLGLSPNQRTSLLDLDGQTVSYTHGPPFISGVIWPNKGSPMRSNLTLLRRNGTTSSLEYRGPWAMFRLLSRGALNGRTATSVDLSFRTGDGMMRYKLSSEKTFNPITQQPFKGFSLPRALLQPSVVEQQAAAWVQ